MTDYTQLTDEDLWARLAEVSDYDRIEVLVELGDRALRVAEYARAQTLLEEARDTAEKLGDLRWVASILFAQGTAAFDIGETEMAVEHFAQAARTYCEIGRSRDAARALLNLADGHRELDQPEECLAAALDAGRLAESEDDSELAGEACRVQALTLQRLGRDKELLQACDAGRAHFQKAGRADQVGQIDELAIAAHLRLGQLDDAQRLASDCLAVARLSGVNAAWTRFRFAEVLQICGAYKKVLKQARIAQREHRSADDLVGVAQCQWLIGDALTGLSRWRKALAAYEEARALFAATGRSREALLCQADQAIVWQVIGKYAKAGRMNRQLVRAFTEAEQDPVHAQRSAARLLENLVAQHRYEECCTSADELMSLWPEGATAATPDYREFLGQWTVALQQTGHPELAVAMATHVINNAPDGFDGQAAANSHEVRGRHRLDNHLPGAVPDLARAIELHLLLGQGERAGALAGLLARATGVADVPRSSQSAA